MTQTFRVPCPGDLVRSDAQSPVKSGLDGTNYEIGRNKSNRAGLREPLAPFAGRALRPPVAQRAPRRASRDTASRPCARHLHDQASVQRLPDQRTRPGKGRGGPAVLSRPFPMVVLP